MLVLPILLVMVKIMAISVIIDSQGRILIPNDIRNRLHFEPNSELEIIILGNELVLRKSKPDLKRQVTEWKERLLSMKIEQRLDQEDEEIESEKWVDEEYVDQKLGLR
ncbi:MAG TPA: AbrB/MazE/SpoVT family DNA-binding domain-containing protein [Candidatus Lokiarchaeia archaeon]|nr:AbrB/MazE/SpoVT family DNA-binding domain-containing protein [Candidatus Lokiarchaeia archaeon]